MAAIANARQIGGYKTSRMMLGAESCTTAYAYGDWLHVLGHLDFCIAEALSVPTVDGMVICVRQNAITMRRSEVPNLPRQTLSEAF